MALTTAPSTWFFTMAMALGACAEPTPHPTHVAEAPSASSASSLPSGAPSEASLAASTPKQATGASATPIASTSPNASPLNANGLTFDGFKLGDRYGSTVLGRDPYRNPCDDDPIDKKRRRFMVYGALPCRGRSFPEGTTVAFYLTFSDQSDRYDQSIEAFAWLGGGYFETRSNFPARTGQSPPAVDSVLGAPVSTVRLAHNGGPLNARHHGGDVWSIAKSDAVVGFVVGSMPSDAESEQWRGLVQMYERYTAPRRANK